MKKLLVLMLVLAMASLASATPTITASSTTVNEGETFEIYITGTSGDASVLPNVAGGGYSGIIWLEYYTNYYTDDAHVSLNTTPTATANAAGGAAQTGNVYDMPNYAVNFLAAPTVHGAGDLYQEADDVDVGLWFTFEVTARTGLGAQGTTDIELWNIGFTGIQDSVTITVVPEPVTIALLGLGGLFLRRRK